jgi:hypothetical protein
MRHGRHWPREEQQANAFEGYDYSVLTDDGVAAARIRLAWGPTLPPYESAADPERPEFNNVGRDHHGY